MNELSPESQAIVNGTLLIKEVRVSFELLEEQPPHFHPLTGERISDPVLYAIVGVLSWMEGFDSYKTSSDRLRLWYEREYMSAMVIAAKGDFSLDMPEFNRGVVESWVDLKPVPLVREERALLYDGPIDGLWAALDGDVGLSQRITVFYAGGGR